GMKYEGEMRLGQPQGKGVYWFLDGTRFEGVFENGLARAGGRSSRRTDHASRPISSTARPSASTRIAISARAHVAKWGTQRVELLMVDRYCVARTFT
nr:hypothetical protein [bacterium]